MKISRACRVVSIITVAFVLAGLTGCNLKTAWYRFADPKSVVCKPDDSMVVSILSATGPMDQQEELPPNATFPTAEDLVYDDKDYVLGPSDVIAISILDLYFEGGETSVQRTLSEGGYIDLPLLDDRLKASGKTKMNLTDDIKQAYVNASILNKMTASISVSIILRRQSVTTVLGAVETPGSYPLARRDIRLLEVIAMAQGRTQSNIDWIYVIRHPKPRSLSGEQGNRARQAPIMPPIHQPKGGGDLDSAIDELRKGIDDTLPKQSVLHLDVSDDGSPTADSPAPSGNDPKWIRKNGKWVSTDEAAKNAAARIEDPVAKAEEDKTGGPIRNGDGNVDDPFGWSQTAYKKNAARVIAINLKRLEQGDPRMNIVIHDHDVVNIPLLESGVFYMFGEIASPGVYDLTGRKITLTQAVASARGFSETAWPENTVLIRRIGPNQEQHIPINLEKIAQGLEPNIFLKPDDVVAVGTHWRATFYAVFRNAFRLSYGAGFIYDRNFANPVTSGTSKRFTRW